MRPWPSAFDSCSLTLRIHSSRLVALVILTIAWSIGGKPADAQISYATPPELTECDLRGLQIGGTTRITLRGQHLKNARLLLPIAHPPKVQVVQADEQSMVCDVSLDSRVVPGLYPLRVVAADGVSTAITIGLDRLKQTHFESTQTELPAAVHGSLAGDQRLVTQFEGTESQTIAIDLEGRRLGSSIRPVIRLFGPDGRQLAIGRPQSAIHGDTRLSFTVPTTGNYRLELHDAVYQGPSPGWFRLKIGSSLAYADRVYPIVSAPGEMHEVEYLGGNLRTTRTMASPLFVPGQIHLQAAWPDDPASLFTGPQPILLPSEPNRAEYTEETWVMSRPQAAQSLGLSGRISKPGEADHFVIPVKAGERLRVELQAARYGSPLDGVLDLFAGDATPAASASGNLGHADDQPATADPAIDIQVPDNVSSVTVRVSSLLPTGSSEHDYHLIVKPIGPLPPRLTFDLARLIIPSGSSVVTPLRIEPQEPRGTWRLDVAEPVSSLVAVDAPPIESDDLLSLVEWRAAPETQGTFFAHLVAFPTNGPLAPTTAVMTSSFPGSSTQPDWLRSIPIAITREAPLQLQWAEQTLPAEWLRGARQSLSLQWTRPASGHAGPMRLSLMTNQIPPTKSENNATVPDPSRTWRMQELSAIRGDQPGSEISVLCPSDLALRNGSLAVKGELLSDDGSTVLATVFSPVVRRPVVDALQLQASLPTKMEAVAGDETGLVIEGMLTRHASAKFPVDVRLEGLPEGMLASTSNVKLEPDQNAWKLVVKVPAETPAQELKEIRVAARFAEAGDAWSEAVSRSGPFVIEIKPRAQ